MLSHFKRQTGIPYKRVHALEADQDAWVQKEKTALLQIQEGGFGVVNPTLV